MFVSVLLAEDQVEMFNLNCGLNHFISHLKQRGGLDVEDSVDLMDTSGKLMNLQEKTDSVESAATLLAERRHYVLLRLRRGDGAAAAAAAALQCIPLLKGASSSHPQFAELLKKLTNPARGRALKTRRRKQ